MTNPRAIGRSFLLCVALSANAQTPASSAPPINAVTPAWQIAAGGHMEFEVASVRPDDGEFKPPSFALSADDWFREPSGRFHADFALPTYIEFAYKLWLTGSERDVMMAGIPESARKQRYDIEATAPLHATKDQYRLMMQALLAERFGLKVHWENREIPVLAMELEKPGQTGPKLIPHSQGPACDSTPGPDVFPTVCDANAAMPKGQLWLAGSRATTPALLAHFLGMVGASSFANNRPVVDRTGLTGLWDYTLLSAPAPRGGAEPTDAPEPGPTALEAIHEQLGLKLRPTRAIVPLLIVDHVEKPAAN
ncbi:soil-associated protein, TIGR03435 family [Bryocella elongata]|uniref:Soil-associated protein, TIGR03435 family n=1 Tax=Bryocella elongata TaxID=863522 RepID=A0A1H5SRY9_9BACT|nr:TIGR03435 family protein [Bryocella elongata]SEF53383.1 soil-associated protein, TIGR03435 family [Bryocella elongata]